MIEELYQQLLQDDEKRNKYHHPGIYSISINDTLVYIGKSHDMLHRIAEHMVATRQAKRHKYQILNQALQNNHQIQFDVLYYAKAKNPFTELFRVEAYYINKNMPPLNIQIPDTKNPQKYTINQRARTITLEEILK